MIRTFSCHICGDYFKSAKPQDPERDRNKGTCEMCKRQQVSDLVRFHGLSAQEATERTEKFA